MKAYVVVEGETDIVILRTVLPAELLEEVFMTPAGDRSNITSIARTLLVTRRKPVAELVDTASVDERIIRERRQTTQELLKAVAAGTPTKVILLIPSIEAIFFASEDLLSRMIGKPIPHDVRLLARGSPKEALERLFAQTEWTKKHQGSAGLFG